MQQTRWVVGHSLLLMAPEVLNLAAAQGLLLLLDVEGATRLGECDGGVARPLLRYHELVLSVEQLVFALAWRPCTSLSVLQVK
jgi:hypothetical protein